MVMNVEGVRKAGNQGMVTTRLTPLFDPCHLIPLNRTARITKIMAYNNTGADVTLQFGTQDATAVPLFVQLFPDLVAIDTLDNEWLETEIPAVEFALDSRAGVLGRSGNIEVRASAAGVLVLIEVEEYGA
jgi:hypothetical protein